MGIPERGFFVDDPVCIVIFCFCRFDKFVQLTESLAKNPDFADFPYYVFQDGGASFNEIQFEEYSAIEPYWNEFSERGNLSNSTFIKSEYNVGLRDSILNGLSHVFERYHQAIVLEDDLIVAPNFLSEMSLSLKKFRADRSISHISGWSPPSLLPKSCSNNRIIRSRMMFCWGWATWSDRWRLFDLEKVTHDLKGGNFDICAGDKFGLGGLQRQVRLNQQGRIKTWAVFWHYHIYLSGKYCANFRYSLVQNNGNDGSGVNCGDIRILKRFNKFFEGSITVNKLLVLNEPAMKSYLYEVNLAVWLILRNFLSVVRKALVWLEKRF